MRNSRLRAPGLSRFSEYFSRSSVSKDLHARYLKLGEERLGGLFHVGDEVQHAVRVTPGVDTHNKVGWPAVSRGQ